MKKTITIIFIIFISFFGIFSSSFNLKNNLYLEKNKTLDSSKDVIYNNSISSQEFINQLEELEDGDVYQLENNVDFSNSAEDDISYVELSNVTIEGNGYTLYNRDLSFFNTTTLIPDSSEGFAKYAFFKNLNNVTINNLNFDNFIFPFGNIINSSLNDVNVFNVAYDNLTFDFSQLSSTYISKHNVVDITLLPLGLVAQDVISSSWNYSYFENINFTNNTIKSKNNYSFIISPIGVVEDNDSYEKHETSFSNFYINNINFSNNSVIGNSLKGNSDGLENNEFESYSVFYNPFIGSTIDSKNPGTFLNLKLNSIIFNDINVSGNTNNFLNYTFYNLIPALSINTKIYGTNIYGFNLNIDTTTDVQDGKMLGTGNLSYVTAYNQGTSEEGIYLKNSSLYQNYWIDEDTYQVTVPLDLYSTYDSIINSIQSQFYYDQNDNPSKEGFNQKYWYFDKTSLEEDLSLNFVKRPSIIDLNLEQYNENDKINFSFYFSDGYLNSQNPYNVELYDYNSGNIFKSWNLNTGDKVEDSISSSDLFYGGNDLHLKISNSNNYWDQKLNTENIVPRVYSVSNIVTDSTLSVSYNLYDPFELINSINITLYNEDSLIEQKNVVFDSETKALDQDNTIIFDSNIDSSNLDKYLIEFNVSYNIGILKTNQYYKENVNLDQKLIQFDSNSSIKFGIIEESFPVYAIVLISLLFLILLIIIILLLVLFIKKRNNSKQIEQKYYQKLEEYGIQDYIE